MYIIQRFNVIGSKHVWVSFSVSMSSAANRYMYQSAFQCHRLMEMCYLPSLAYHCRGNIELISHVISVVFILRCLLWKVSDFDCCFCDVCSNCFFTEVSRTEKATINSFTFTYSGDRTQTHRSTLHWCSSHEFAAALPQRRICCPSQRKWRTSDQEKNHSSDSW